MIIGLTGLAGSGKDTVAGHLIERYGFEPISFAAPLYAAVGIITGMSYSELSDRDVKEKPIKWLGRSPREILQSLGTEWGRKMIHENLWVMVAMHRVAEITEDGGNVVITDVRFDNEAIAIKLAGGDIWKVDRPGVHTCVGDCAEHESEKGVSEALVDHTVLNDKSLLDLNAQVDFQLIQYKDGQAT